MKVKNLDSNGSLYTLEALATAVLILLALLFVTQATPLTPLTSSASNQQIEFQLMILGQDLLTTTNYSEDPVNTSSSLKSAILNWDGARQNNLAGKAAPNSFERALLSIFGTRGIAYNVEVIYLNTSSYDLVTSPMIWNGEPSDNAVVVYETVVIYDSDTIHARNPLTDIDSGSRLYNIALVKLTVWRM